MDSDPGHATKLVPKWLEDSRVRVLQRPSQSPVLSPGEKIAGRAEKEDVSKVVYKTKDFLCHHSGI